MQKLVVNWTLRNDDAHNFDRNVVLLLLSCVRILLISRQNSVFLINSIGKIKLTPRNR